MTMCDYIDKTQCEHYFPRFGVAGSTECGHQLDIDKDYVHCGYTEQIGINLKNAYDEKW